MSDKISILDSKVVQYEARNGKRLCMIYYTIEEYDLGAIFPVTDMGLDLGVATVRGEKTDTYTIKAAISPSYLDEFPDLKKIDNKAFESPEYLLEAFGNIVYP